MKTVLYPFIAATLSAHTRTVHASVSGIPTNDEAPTTSGFTNATKHISRGESSLCTSGIAHVAANTNENVRFDYKLPATQAEATQTWLKMWAAGSTFPDSISNGTLHVNGTYEIGATLCMPSNGSTSKLQVLTHGIGFDRYYWDFAPGWSYVDVAVEAGYSTFLYDRLGVGVSSKEDPIHTIHTLTKGLIATHPADLDAAILTGFSTNASGIPAFNLGQNPTIASLDQPYRFSSLNNGYFVVASPLANQQTFFTYPNFLPTILSLADATKGTVTIGELFTASAVVKPALNVTFPVAVVAGNEDLGFCAGNCIFPENLLEEVGTTLYENVPEGRFETLRVKGAGHGLNLHFEARGAFDWILGFLGRNGV
ncbi:hypothetical protein M409DRAFT_65250 [Zasmidium cellare ATCC 36951]|uniref:AB hydrolase-1 domain-containing protein n=1 Tax=Zasmidium cellare ATCC 36951 TaxID=1080233 RepID=A0A6A6CSU1_ZASCE|nr:uncharacterized protein M409DRAFT_65250 [Zasmidium cellare ATCC 36951]KAF2168892.1 hypothetical protein M409DRAFT_65250 [Zasmidium cellare ATCC 36951]